MLVTQTFLLSQYFITGKTHARTRLPEQPFVVFWPRVSGTGARDEEEATAREDTCVFTLVAANLK